MKVLITGGAGFIGSNLVAELVTAGGYDVAVLDNESAGRFGDIADFGVRCIRADLLDEAALRDVLVGIDTVVHLAADTRVMESIADPSKNFRTNVIGSFGLLSLARDAGVRRIVNASTGGAILGEAPAPIHERIAARPLSPYGASKLAVEGYCSAFSGAYGMKAVSLRFSNIFGPRSYHKGSVVAHFFRLLLNGEPLTVYGDGSQVRDYLYVGDLVQGIRAAIDSDVLGAIQLASGRPTTLNELIGAMREVLGTTVPVSVRHEPVRRGEVHTTWCDISLARQELGFSPSTSLVDGLAATWAWFRNMYAGGGAGDRAH
jgi:UDP-glucose 4-epimerase